MNLEPFKNCLAHKNSIYISNEAAPAKPCCWFKTGIKADSVEEYREKLSDLDIEYNCQHCIKQEASGSKWSHRHLFQDPKEFVLGVCLDNICNLKCVTCSPIHSSKLINEWEDLNLYEQDHVLPHETDKKYFIKLSKQAPDKIKFVKSVLNNSDFDSLKLEIFGGEPLVNPKVFDFIDWVSEQEYANKTFLSITTNATVYTEKMKEYTEKFKSVALQLSIDGIEEVFEYLRYGANWEDSSKVISNYYSMLDTVPNFSLAFNYTLSWMNSLHFIDFFNWAYNNYPKNQTHLTKLEEPRGYSVDVLSISQRKFLVNRFLENIDDNIDNPDYQKFIDFYKQSMIFENFDDFDSELYDQGINAMANKDELRGLNYKDVFSDILEFIKE